MPCAAGTALYFNLLTLSVLWGTSDTFRDAFLYFDLSSAALCELAKIRQFKSFSFSRLFYAYPLFLFLQLCQAELSLPVHRSMKCKLPSAFVFLVRLLFEVSGWGWITAPLRTLPLRYHHDPVFVHITYEAALKREGSSRQTRQTDYIFTSFKIIEPILVTLIIKYLWRRCKGVCTQSRKLQYCIWRVSINRSCVLCFITKTCLYNVDPLKPHFYIVKLGFTGVYIIFLISAQNIDCGYSLEPPRRGGSKEYPQSIFRAEIWKISEFLSEIFHFSVVKNSVYLNRRVFFVFKGNLFDFYWVY